MLTIHFAWKSVRMSVDVPDIGVARLVWDALNTKGFDMLSKRP